MAPLGLFMTTLSGIGGFGAAGGDGAGLFVEDYMWQLGDNGTVAGELEPVPLTYDFHDIWDVDSNDDYMLDTATATADEGYWILDSNGDVEPLDV